MVQSVTSKINEEEAALYDRQIRLWGLDAQIRLRNASVLLAGLNGLGAEVAKNLMLAGLQSLTLMDDNVVSEKDIKSQFFLSRDSVGQNRAEASLAKCQQLNPLVKLTADVSQFDSKTEDFYKQFDLVCIIMDAFDEKVIKINEICRQNGVKFICGGCFGWFGFSFNDFLDHEFAEEVNVTEVENTFEPSPKKLKANTKEETQTIKKMVEQFVSFGDALKIDIKPENIQKWKKVLSGYLILQILRKYSEKFRRRPSKTNKIEDVSELETMKNQLVSELVEATKEKIDIPNFNAELLLDDLSPVCAIVGGILAQELIKAVSNKDRPLSNIFFYNGMDFTGTVGKQIISKIQRDSASCITASEIMTYLRPFRCDDLFKFNNVNLDPLTETYGVNFYLQYLARWPEYFQVAESPTGEIMGYIMGKAEGREELWHGHVTAVTVAPEYRRLGLAGMLMKSLEDISESKDCYFVDLFVRVSNRVAVDMYHKLGYIIYRRVLDYYSGDPDEDAFDMRKALPRDVDRKSVIPQKNPIRPEDVEF